MAQLLSSSRDRSGCLDAQTEPDKDEHRNNGKERKELRESLSAAENTGNEQTG